MALSKEWYDAEFVDSESESLHRAPSIEYSFYNAVKTGDMEYVIKNCKEDAFIHLFTMTEQVYCPEILYRISNITLLSQPP